MHTYIQMLYSGFVLLLTHRMHFWMCMYLYVHLYICVHSYVKCLVKRRPALTPASTALAHEWLVRLAFTLWFLFLLFFNFLLCFPLFHFSFIKCMSYIHTYMHTTNCICMYAYMCAEAYVNMLRPHANPPKPFCFD